MSETFRPSVFDYWDIRLFLKDFVRYLSAAEKLSLRAMSKLFGLKNAGHLSLVLAGKRPIGIPLIKKFERVFRLAPEETRYFFSLYEYHLADTDLERRRLQLALIAQQKRFKVKEIDTIVADFLGQWQLQVLFEILGEARTESDLHKFAEDLEMNPTEIKSALKKMEAMDLLQTSGQGTWVRKFSRLQTPSDQLNSLNRIYLSGMAKRAVNAIDQVPPEKREVIGFTVGTTKEQFQEMRAEILEFQQNLNGKYGESDKVEVVYQVNIQAFPLLDLSSK